MAASELRREKYIVKLTKTERTHLWELLNKGKSPAKLDSIPLAVALFTNSHFCLWLVSREFDIPVSSIA